MLNLNLKVRIKNPVFIFQLILAIFTPILAYSGLAAEDLTSWKTLMQLIIDAVSNPYVIGLTLISLWNAVTDPTTKGFSDSARAMTYDQPSANTDTTETESEDKQYGSN